MCTSQTQSSGASIGNESAVVSQAAKRLRVAKTMFENYMVDTHETVRLFDDPKKSGLANILCRESNRLLAFHIPSISICKIAGDVQQPRQHWYFVQPR